ncbi:MAG TPA: hypothetical protein VEY92_09090 [Pseudoxanthomonas sp.]|nr:hypothetical protein [Pseudoxanthomonas sp.]
MPAAASSLTLVALARLIGWVAQSPLLGGGYGTDIRRHGSGNAGGINMRRTPTRRVDLVCRLLARGVAALVPFAHCSDVQLPHGDNGLRFECVLSWRRRA